MSAMDCPIRSMKSAEAARWAEDMIHANELRLVGFGKVIDLDYVIHELDKGTHAKGGLGAREAYEIKDRIEAAAREASQ